MNTELQSGLEYRTLELNYERFEILISNGSVLDWSIAISTAMVPIILGQNHWKSKQNGSHFVQISNSFGQNGHHFVLISNSFRQNGCHCVQNRTPLENRTEGYTIGIPNAFVIPAPTVVLWLEIPTKHFIFGAISRIQLFCCFRKL